MTTDRLHRCLALAATILMASFGPASSQDLPARLLVGYWHNWTGSPNSLLLTEVPAAYDVVCVAFAVPVAADSGVMQFTPDPGLYPEPAAFTADVASLQARGQRVLISIGGANHPVRLHDPDDAQDFAASMSQIIADHGFDGLDIDLEGHSLFLEPGDTDHRAPTSPLIVNFLSAMEALLAQQADDFVVSAAPETAFVQGGYLAYGGIWGAYLPVLHGLRDHLTYVHVQHYNTGTMYGRDGAIYAPATADFHVAMADMLLAGFTVAGGLEFEPLRPDQVLVGLPASPGAAGSGYTEAAVVQQALDYLVCGVGFGGLYQLAQPEGYPAFRGLMTWSANWDVASGLAFSSPHRAYLDGLDPPTAVHSAAPSPTAGLLSVHPNPFNPATTIAFELPAATVVRLDIHDLGGRLVSRLVDGPRSAGRHEVAFVADGLPSGVYRCRLTAGVTVEERVMTVVK